MKTIRTFFNIAQAGLACSVLKAAGIDATLADENAYTLGPQYVPWGIRLQVPEPDADQAERVLDNKDGFPPLPDDFVPPLEPSQESAPPSRRAENAMNAFLRGGMWAVGIFGAFVVVNLANGRPAHADPGAALLLFALGGVVGSVVPAIYNKGQREESTENRDASSDTGSDGP